MQHSKSFQKYYDRYQRGGCTKEQLQKLVSLGVIYDWEYDEIVGPEPNENGEVPTEE